MSKIIFTQGDDAITITMQVNDENGVGIDLTGSVFETKIKGFQSLVVVPNAQHTADPNQTANKGKFTFTMTKVQTSGCVPGDAKDIVTKVVQSGTTIYYHGKNALTVLPAAPVE